MPNNEVVILDASDGVATVTLNRPEARNALSRELLQELAAVMGECDRRDDVRVVVITGADPAFCAGLDLRELATSSDLLRAERGPEDAQASGSRSGSGSTGPVAKGPVATGPVATGPVATGPVATGDSRSADNPPRPGPFPTRRKPLIGAVNGPAVTGGLELALACDFLIASDRARFADTHSRVGVQPAWGLSVLLPQAVGLRRAREMSASGNFVDADTALAWGLVNHVVAHEKLLSTASSIAADIAGNDPAGVERLLATYAEGSLLSAGEALRLELDVAAEWLRAGHGRPDEVARRKQAIIDRGRSQVG
jgi:enoyl-CoA hydratase